MEDKELEKLDIVMKVYKKTLYSDIVGVKVEDIPKTIEKIFSKCLKKKVIIEGDGLTKEIKATVYDKDI